MPAVEAISPGLNTFSERALFGWSPARYVIGVPSFNPNSFAAAAFTRPCSENVGLMSAIRELSKP